MRNNVDVELIHKRNGEYLSFEYAHYKFDLEIRHRIIGIMRESGVGKTCLLPRIAKVSKTLKLPLIQYFDQNDLEVIEETMNGNITFHNRPERIIIIDNADLYFKLLDIDKPELFADIKNNILSDPNHIYIVIGRAIPLPLSCRQVARFKYDKSDKTFYLKYISD